MAAETATRILRNSHKVIAGLLDQAQADFARAPEMEAGVIRELCMMLEIHAKLEEEFLYLAVQNDLEIGILVGAGRDELAALGVQILGLRTSEALSGRAQMRLSEITELFSLHAMTEEEKLFPKVEAQPGLNLAELGEKMLARKRELLEEPRYRDSLPPRVQDPKGGEQKRRAA
jgi:hemerythrin superfamily protein